MRDDPIQLLEPSRLQKLLRRGWRGLRLILAGRVDRISYALVSRWRGLDFAGASVSELGLSPDRAHLHANSGGPCLKRMFKSLGVPAGSRIVDLGSGKGGALITLAAFAFDEIVGVEISQQLVDIARENLERLRLRNVTLVRGDATEFRDLDRFTHIYMFNPFPAAVMRQVMANIAESIQRSPRRVTLVMKWPGSPDEFIEPELFGRPVEHKFRLSHSFFVAVHDPALNGRPPRRPAGESTRSLPHP